MALPPFRDLEPRYDVKGGSPKSPVPPITVSEYQQYAMPPTDGHGNGVWKLAATAAVSVLLGFMVAWWTALQGRGVTQAELHEYVKEYSPWVIQKAAIEKQLSDQAVQIGEIRGRQEQVLTRLSKVEYGQVTQDRDFVEFKADTKQKMGTVADYLESQKTKK